MPEDDQMFAGARRAAGYIEGQQVAPPPSIEPAFEKTPARVHIVPAEPEVPATAAPATDGSAVVAATPDELLDPAIDLSIISTAQPAAVATKGIRGVLSRVGIKVQPGSAEQAQLDAAAAVASDEEVIRQATWTRAVSILVGNKKGGSGKTPTALIVGGILALVRGGSVTIMEVSDDSGALTFRAEGNPTRGIGELVRDAAIISSAGQLAGYTAPQTSYASVIGTVGHRPRLTKEGVIAAARVVDEFQSIRVMDSGNQPSSEAFEGAVETSDALVIPVLNAGDAVLEALAMIDQLRAQGGPAAALADNAIVIRLTDGRPEHPQVVQRVDRIIDHMRVGQVFSIPYDAHIAERGQVTLSRLSPATRRAFTAATAGIIRALQATTQKENQ